MTWNDLPTQNFHNESTASRGSKPDRLDMVNELRGFDSKLTANALDVT